MIAAMSVVDELGEVRLFSGLNQRQLRQLPAWRRSVSSGPV